MSVLNVALVSLDQAWENKKENLIECEKYIHEASSRNVDLIIFPEMTLSGFSVNITNISEDKKHSQTINSFTALAKKYDIAIVFGVVIKHYDKAHNCSCFLDKQGNTTSNYSKIHPFTFAGEDKFYSAGAELSIANFQGYKIGLSICYDLRFPELYSALAKQSDLIINIANWPKKRVDHWNTLLKARAIENQIFIVGVNRIGIDGNALEYVESSNVFNANGEQLEYEQSGEMKMFEIDKEWTRTFKNKFLTVKDRKIELYKGIL